MEDYADRTALDAGLVASAQAVEHYAMTRYGTLKSQAQQLGPKDAVSLLAVCQTASLGGSGDPATDMPDFLRSRKAGLYAFMASLGIAK